MDLTSITNDCLERLASGESVADCLARYPQAADQLAPMLSAAGQLRIFSQARLTEGQRLRARMALREELAAQHERSRHTLRFGWARLRIAPFAAAVAVLLFVSIAFTAVAASQPGDLVYPVRVAVERAPALVQPDAARRAAAELAFADRRLADLAEDQSRDPVAVNALLRSDHVAVERAGRLSDAERAQILARVQSHAAALGSLASRATDPRVALRLREAAERAAALAGRPGNQAPGAEIEWTSTPSPQRPTSTPAPGRSVATVTVPEPTTTAVVEPTLAASPTAARATPRLRSRLTDTPPAASRTPLASRPTESPRRSQETPRPRSTVSVAPPVVTVVVTVEAMPTVAPPTVQAPTVIAPTVVVRTVVVPKVVAPTVVAPTVVAPTVSIPTITVPTVVAPTLPPWAPPTPASGNGGEPTAIPTQVIQLPAIPTPPRSR